jgi:hypothetical protein
MLGRRRGTVVDTIRDAIVAEVHFADVKPIAGRPTELRIEGPGALTGVAERAVVGHERALRRAGFRVVECLGVDPHDPRGRHGRLRAAVPEPGGEWTWDRLSGDELQQRIIHGDEVTPLPRPVAPSEDANVIPLAARARRR